MNLEHAVSADEAIASLKSGMRVFVHGAAATPAPLLEALVRNTSLRDITLYHLHTTGAAPFVDPPHRERFRSVSLFAGPPVRRAIEEGAADFMPVFLSDIPRLFLTGRIQLDAALLQLSPPDAHGYCPLGTSVDAALAAAISARILVAEINAHVKPGAGVVTTRGHVHWVVTEHGAANLFGLTLRQRAEALIALADPDFRAELRHSFANARSVVLGAVQ